MPKRYAYNTSATQIKKRYAMIGATATKVKKRYAMIGSTATLVYSAEEVLYTNGVQNVAWVGTGDGYGSGSVTFNDAYVELKSTGQYSNGSRKQAMFTAEKIDLTDYDTIKVLVSGYDSYLRYTAADGFVLGVTDSIIANFFNNSIVKTNLNPASKTDEIREVTMDISSLEGKYHIGIGLFAYKMYDYTDTAYVYQVWLE